MISSVNFHLWEPCNMRCNFCFATFQDVKSSILPKGHLPKEEAIEVIKQLAEMGFEKITFAGGEPTLCPWLSELISTAKNAGMTTMIVTNGSNITIDFLEKNKKHLDWIALSIESINPETNIKLGRAILGKKPLSLDYYKNTIDLIHQYGYGLKINSVITRKNYFEDISSLIEYAKPKRWKIFQALPIKGQNDNKIDDFTVNEEQFNYFINNHKHLESITKIIPESNTVMKGSYAMVDPAGRFYDNSQGKHNYSRPINEIGAKIAIQQVNYDLEKFIERGGIYDWNNNKPFPSKITLSGYVASGKSTIGQLLANYLQYEFISIGNKTREYAESKGYSISEFQKICLANPHLDKQIDTNFAQACNLSESLIIDYRLGFKFIKNAYHIFLNISEKSAINRLIKNKRISESHETLKERNDSFRKQFLNSYGVDYTLSQNYDLIVNVDEFNSKEEILDFIISQIKKNYDNK
jgi:radical S-adenosyl methionine domain-containing protein 2